MKLINLKQINPSKSNIPDLVEKLTQSVNDGWEDAVSLSAKLDFILKVCAEARSSIKEIVLKDIESGKTATGYKVEISEVGVSYDYSNCNDSEIEALTNQMNAIKEKIKEREKFLKSLSPSGFEFADPETGELIKLYPPAKKSTTSPKFTLQK